MWNPGFEYLECRPAVLQGYHRVFAMFSTRYRGTAQKPGLVLSLAPGGTCRGVVFRMETAHRDEIWEQLDRREWEGRAHRRVWAPVRLEDGNSPCLCPVQTYVPVSSFSNYIPGIPLRRQAELIVSGRGERGPSLEYLLSLVGELNRHQMREPEIEKLHRETLALL